MSTSEVLTMVTSLLGFTLTVAGGIIRHLLTKLGAAETLLDAKNETIGELRRQVDRLEITAQLQDRVLGALPRPSSNREARDDRLEAQDRRGGPGAGRDPAARPGTRATAAAA
jgi:hypothetical protein